MAQIVGNQTEGEGETEEYFTNEGEGEGIYVNTNSEEFRKVKKILSRHDEDNRITMQVISNLEQDGITLDLLCEFDDQSLVGVIDSWVLNTFDKKYFLIRGLLINGIKKLNVRNTIPNINNDNVDNKSDEKTEQKNFKDADAKAKIDEKKQIKSLNKFLKTINKQLETYENESKMADTARNELFTQYINEIKARFEKLEKDALKEIKQRRDSAINTIEANFSNIGREEEEYYKRLKSLKTEIGRLSLSNNINKNKNIIEMRDKIIKKCEIHVDSNIEDKFNICMYSHVINPIPKKWNAKLVNIVSQYCTITKQTKKSKKQRKKEAKALAKQKKKEQKKLKEKEKKKEKEKEQKKAKQWKAKQTDNKDKNKNTKRVNDWATSQISIDMLSRNQLAKLIDHRSKMTLYLEVYNKNDLLKLLRSGYSLHTIKSQERDFEKMSIDGLKLELRLRDKNIINDVAYKDENKNVLVEKLKQFVVTN